MIENAIVLDEYAEPRPFDWRFALVTFVMELDEEDLYTDTIDKWEPGYDLQAGERDELRAVELAVRKLWERYGPPKPPRAVPANRNVVAENAAVDQYQAQAMKLKGVILRLVVTDEWRSYFPPVEHENIERARQIIIRHGGDRPV